MKKIQLIRCDTKESQGVRETTKAPDLVSADPMEHHPVSKKNPNTRSVVLIHVQES